jgi:hypothetical protein
MHGMTFEKPRGTGKKEEVKLDSAASHLLEECRMVLPGIQALFGFQLIAVFNEGFAQKLSSGEQALHLAAIVLVTVAIALVMAPVAIHRWTSLRAVTERFIWMASQLLLFSMAPLVIGLCLDVYLVARVIADSIVGGVAAATALLAVFIALWVVLPWRERGKQA